MNAGLLIGFCLASLMLALSPGPDNIYVLTESIARGWRQGVGITAGLISGVIVHTALVATGLSLLIYQHDIAYDIMKFMGAAYLLYLAYGGMKEQKEEMHIGVQAKHESFSVLFKRGFLMNVLNPKVTMFFIVLLPQFVDPAGIDPMYQMFVLGLLFMAMSFPVFTGIALVADRVVEVVRTDRFWIVTKWIKVTVLIVLAVLLILSENSV